MRTKEKMKHFLGLKYLTTPLASLSTGDKSVSPNVWLFVMETLLEVTLDFFIWKSIKFLNICSLYFKSIGIYSFGRCLFLTFNHFLYWGANYEWALDGDFNESTVGDDIGTPGVARCGSASVTCYRITEAQSSLRQENRYLYTHLTATIVNITNVWMLQDYISFHIVSPNSWDSLIVGADMEDGPVRSRGRKCGPNILSREEI